MNNNNSFRNGIQKFQILYLYLYSQIPMPTQESIIIANLFLLFLNGIKRHDTIKKKKRVFTSSCSFFVSFFSISFRSSQTKFFEFYFLLPLLIWLIDCNQSFFFNPTKIDSLEMNNHVLSSKLHFTSIFFSEKKKLVQFEWQYRDLMMIVAKYFVAKFLLNWSAQWDCRRKVEHATVC